MPNLCPVCESELTYCKGLPNSKMETRFICPMCGEFVFSDVLAADLPNTIKIIEYENIKISHAIRLMQQLENRPVLYTSTIDEILKKPLPKPAEQADIFIRWLANANDKPGKFIAVQPYTHMTIMGAKTTEGFNLVLNHLVDRHILMAHIMPVDGSPDRIDVALSMEGWKYFEELEKGEGSYRKAFMAMKFDDVDLEKILEDIFKPAAKQAGFELVKLEDKPIAGLIDDRIRVEIQSSDFIIADLTHDNLGAYWEAGYAEGLGKPVIYTCEKEKFKTEKTHFDTNHHLTIIWDKNDPANAGERLKATIRATLPQLAKQEDE